MRSLLVLLVALCFACVATAKYQLRIFNKGKTEDFTFLITYDAGRSCWCLKNTQTATIQGINGGNIKLFWSSDCTGSYNTLSSNGVVNGATWVNSVSFGASGVSSDGPNGYCPNWYTIG
ncbi:hypothetical protein BGZ73_003277 [Actinomortierella ambigua]|nr:hypothetical protein BGZ73_003277 [Actinomortierella ambigua]